MSCRLSERTASNAPLVRHPGSNGALQIHNHHVILFQAIAGPQRDRGTLIAGYNQCRLAREVIDALPQVGDSLTSTDAGQDVVALNAARSSDATAAVCGGENPDRAEGLRGEENISWV